MAERLTPGDVPEEPDDDSEAPESRDQWADQPLPPDHRWRPVEYGNSNPAEALADVDQEPESDDADNPADLLEFDQTVWDRLPAWEPGDKARAWLVTEQGESFVISGKDQETKDTLRDALPRIDRMIISTHVEAHVSAKMRRDEVNLGALYINRVPCAGWLGCDEQLPRMLPPGATLAVYGPDDFSKVYEGLPEGDR